MLTHTGERPFKCEIFISAYIQTGNLMSNLCNHIEERPFKCEAYSAALGKTFRLKTRTCTRTGERPVKCEQCHAAFRQTDNLKSHMWTHTGYDHLSQKSVELHSIRGMLKKHMHSPPPTMVKSSAAFIETGNLKRHTCTHTVHSLMSIYIP